MNEQLAEMDARLTSRLDTLAESIQVLTEQVGRITESIARLELLLTEGVKKRDEQIDRLTKNLEDQISLSREQAHSVASLTKLVSQLLATQIGSPG